MHTVVLLLILKWLIKVFAGYHLSSRMIWGFFALAILLYSCSSILLPVHSKMWKFSNSQHWFHACSYKGSNIIQREVKQIVNTCTEFTKYAICSWSKEYSREENSNEQALHFQYMNHCTLSEMQILRNLKFVRILLCSLKWYQAHGIIRHHRAQSCFHWLCKSKNTCK